MKPSAALRVYRLALRLLPPHFRAYYGADLTHSVQEALGEEALRGSGRVLLRLLRELFDVLLTSMRVRLAGSPPVHQNKPERDGVPGMLRNLRITARTLLRRPGFALAAALTLGAGVGCAAAAFGVVDSLLLQPLPHVQSEQLVMVWRDLPRFEMTRAPVSLPTLVDLRSQSAAVLSALEGYTGGASGLLQSGAEPESVSGACVTG